MDKQEQVSIIKTRRALNSLQYSPNGKDIAGMKVQENLSNTIQTKKGLFESKNKINVKNSLKKRASISLPDICAHGNQSVVKSATSTPNKNHRTTSTSTTPTKIARREAIAVILEEKENPNNLLNLNIEKKTNENIILKDKLIKSKENLVKCKEISIQCNKSDEDMLLNSSVENTPYWKLLAYKRYRSLQETNKENQEVNLAITNLDKKNEELREKNKQLLEALKEYDEIKKLILESIDEDDEEDAEDSGYEKSQLY